MNALLVASRNHLKEERPGRSQFGAIIGSHELVRRRLAPSSERRIARLKQSGRNRDWVDLR